jgi:mannosyltransferase OCH1-like enzyme
VIIPRRLHQIWLGPNPLPEEFAAYRETWRMHHPDWELKLWTEENLPSDLRRHEVYDRLRVPAERADILRLEVLWREGGVYVDTDFECRQSLEPFVGEVDFFTAYLKPGRMNNAIIGATARHPILDRALNVMHPRTRYGYDKRAAGPLFFDDLVSQYTDVRIFEPSLFYPSTLADQAVAVAIHHQARSWKDSAGYEDARDRAKTRLTRARARLKSVEDQIARADNRLATLAAPPAAGAGSARFVHAWIMKARAGELWSRALLSAKYRSRLVVRPLRARVKKLALAVPSPLTMLRGRRATAAHPSDIPRTLHLFWLGETDPDADELRRRRSWALSHPGWEFKTWTEANLPAAVPPEVRDRMRAPAERVDLLRLEVLLRYGGVAIGGDLFCLRSAAIVLAGRNVAIATREPGQPSTAFVAATPRHPLIAQALAEARPREFYGYDDEATGAGALARALGGDTSPLLSPSWFFPAGPREREAAVAAPRTPSSEALAQLRAETIELEEALRQTLQEVSAAEARLAQLEAQRELLETSSRALPSGARRG